MLDSPRNSPGIMLQPISQPQSPVAIAELDSINADNIPDWVFEADEPIVLRGLVRNWPLVELGNQSTLKLIDTLRSSYAGQPAPVYFGAHPNNRRLAYNRDTSALNFEIRNSSLTALFYELETAIEDSNRLIPVRYIASNIIDYYFPNLRKDNDLNFDRECFQRHPLEGGDPLVGIWIGNQTLSPCHFDAQNNIACCVAGERKFTLFPPSQIENLYPGPLHLNPGGQAITMVDFDQPDFDRYPKFAEALKHQRVALLEPGDAIFIPVMWWHQVESLSPFNVLINYWWNSFPKMLGQGATALEHALLSIRQRSPQEREAWKAIFNYYVFDDMQEAVGHLPDDVHGPLGPLDDSSARRLRSQILKKLNR